MPFVEAGKSLADLRGTLFHTVGLSLQQSPAATARGRCAVQRIARWLDKLERAYAESRPGPCRLSEVS